MLCYVMLLAQGVYGSVTGVRQIHKKKENEGCTVGFRENVETRQCIPARRGGYTARLIRSSERTQRWWMGDEKCGVAWGVYGKLTQNRSGLCRETRD